MPLEKFTATIKRFNQKGEKTGWTYVEVPNSVADRLNPGNKKSFRVKGKLDNLAIEQVALIPMGDGDFILPLNQSMRKEAGFRVGMSIELALAPDKSERPLNALLLACLDDAPDAKARFYSLPPSHRKYYSKWIESAKTEATQMKRVAQCIAGLERGLDFGASTKLDL